jgi:hypothetical protein
LAVAYFLTYAPSAGGWILEVSFHCCQQPDDLYSKMEEHDDAKWRSMMMLGQISYGLFSAVLAGLMRVASVRDKQDRPNAAAAMLSARVN